MPSAQAPLGATATVNFTMPLGFAPPKDSKPSYGLMLGYGQQFDSLTSDGRIATRSAKLADIRFTDSFRLKKAEVMTFDLANLDKDRRLNMNPEDGKDSTTWIVIGLVVAGVAVCLLADCFDGGDDDDDDDDDGNNTSNNAT
jgi:hypothetical protein